MLRLADGGGGGVCPLESLNPGLSHSGQQAQTVLGLLKG